MIKHWYPLIFLILLSSTLLGQSNVTKGQRGYYATDSTMLSGEMLIDAGETLNSSYCRVVNGERITGFTPSEIVEYGFINGKTYFSKDIQISNTTKRVFLELIVKGKTRLYYYAEEGLKTFYIEKDSARLIKLPGTIGEKDSISLNKFLLTISADCPEIENVVKLVHYNRNSLSKFIESYNDCNLLLYPVFKYGISIGYGFSKPFLSRNNNYEYIRQLNYQYNAGFKVGLFIDVPISVSDFSTHLELYYSSQQFLSSRIIYGYQTDFNVNTSTVTVPFLIRYTDKGSKIKPFINAGGNIAYNFVNENTLFRDVIENNTFYRENLAVASYISEINLGFSLGAGLECELNNKNSLLFEIRYTNLYGLSNSSGLNQSEILFTTGISF